MKCEICGSEHNVINTIRSSVPNLKMCATCLVNYDYSNITIGINTGLVISSDKMYITTPENIIKIPVVLVEGKNTVYKFTIPSEPDYEYFFSVIKNNVVRLRMKPLVKKAKA